MSKIAVITGGNRGLGRNTALALAGKGVDLIITYRTNAAEAAEVVEAIGKLGRIAVAFPLDTAEIDTFGAFAEDLKAALREHWGRESFDYLVNNAGVGLSASIADTTPELFDDLMNVHFRGVFFLTQRLLPLIADGGKIINLSTGLARFAGEGGYSVYGAVKGAVEVFTRYLAKEVGPRGITANVVAPGPIGTDFAGGVLRDNEQVRAHLGGQSALGRIGEPDDIGGIIATLLTGETGWVTAQRIEASGGMLI